MMIMSFVLLLNSQTSFALEAMKPVSLCSRMIHKDEKALCEKNAKVLKLDWYAATACNALTDDKKFLKCWQEVAGAEFNPESLGRCVENPDDKDDAVYSCIISLKNNRLPASVKQPYQTLEIRRQKGMPR